MCILLVPKGNSALCFYAAYEAHSKIMRIVLSPDPARYKQTPTVLVFGMLNILKLKDENKKLSQKF